MKIKNRNKNAIILGTIVASVVFVALLLISYLYIYGQITSIEEKKQEFAEVVANYNEIKQKGLDYTTFKGLITKKKFKDKELTKLLLDNYVRGLLTKVDEGFYNKNFINQTDGDYNKFLEDKLKKFEEDGVLDAFREKEKKLSAVLPVYISDLELEGENSGDDDGVLTDFKFVNYVENLLYKYKLKTSSPIGIPSIVLLEDNKDKIKKNNSETSEAGIYYISLKLDIEGSKKNIILFLRDIYSMGTVVEKDGDIEIKSTKHILETTTIEMKDYIDSSDFGNPEDPKDLFNLIMRGQQAKEAFKMTTELRFYMMGIPHYKILEEAQKVIAKTGEKSYNYYKLLSRVNTQLKSLENSEKTLYTKKLKDISTYLGGIKEEVALVLSNIKQGKDAEKNFRKVLEYKELFMLIDRELNEISNKINLN